jgi:sugar O-acyltransferase (sialic acid O-acetyltransferase NeuD family)
MSLPLIIMGNGGHAQVLGDMLQQHDVEIIGFTSPLNDDAQPTNNGLRRIGEDEEILSYPPESIRLINGIGSIGDSKKRNDIFKKFSAKGYLFSSAIHGGAVIANNVIIGEGVQVMAGSIIQTGSLLGDNVILNTKCSVDHHCIIGDHCHISPGATLAGAVTLNENIHIGAGATVIQNIEIGAQSLIAAGSLVLENLPKYSKVAGVPARPM